MEADKAIEQLSDYCDRGIVTLGDDFKNAVRAGKKALMFQRDVMSLAGMGVLTIKGDEEERKSHEPD
ncbi:unnamed protein product [marine sediment metagenome]|uniref:Uncharacterized protein n=1 Tax=marine sediment metagenome TaxID=412755 RepID=X1TUS8_9ZZZZ